MPTMKELREQKGLTQTDIVMRTGLNVATVSRIENGRYKPTRRTKMAIAQALGVQPEEIEWPTVNRVR